MVQPLHLHPNRQTHPEAWLTQEIERVSALRGAQTDAFLRDLVVATNQLVV